MNWPKHAARFQAGNLRFYGCFPKRAIVRLESFFQCGWVVVDQACHGSGHVSEKAELGQVGFAWLPAWAFRNRRGVGGDPYTCPAALAPAVMPARFRTAASFPCRQVVDCFPVPEREVSRCCGCRDQRGLDDIGCVGEGFRCALSNKRKILTTSASPSSLVSSGTMRASKSNKSSFGIQGVFTALSP